jgi:putative phosphoesterase
MKAIIFSDSHGSFNPMVEAIEKEGKIDLIIHAGDVVRDAEDLQMVYPRCAVAYVKGNNDWWDRSAPEDRFFEFDGVKIFLTHGHNYGVKYSLIRLAQKGSEMGADICIFGHTHSVCNEVMGEITLFNSGSASKHYGILETHKGDFVLKIRDI